MALPHMPATYKVRDNMTDMVARRNKEHDFRQQWDHHAGYFHWQNATINQIQAWESKASFKNRFVMLSIN